MIGRGGGDRREGGRPLGGPRSGALVLGGAGLALLLASCSSGPATADKSSTTTTKASGRTTTTTAPPATTTTAPSPTTTVAGLATCQPGQLHIAAGQSTGAAGTIALTMHLTNSSSVRCGLDGYPGMQLLNAQGTDIPTTVVRDQAQFPFAAANGAPTAVTITPGASATFAIEYSDVPSGNETSCPSSVKAEITPPNDFTSAVVTLSIAPCDNGTVHVSPVYAS